MKFIRVDVLIGSLIVVLMVVSVFGILSFDTSNGYQFENQYGEYIKMWGSGIYEHDSYFKAPIFIGTDCVVLIVMIPLMIIGLIKNIQKRNNKTKIFLLATIATSLYYATSIAFGVTFNKLHLIYILLFSLSFFALIYMISSIDNTALADKRKYKVLSKGLSVYLIISGISLFIAWLPDIIPTILTEDSLNLIEVYTTEITYVIDMGIVSPVIFICLYQLKNSDVKGVILLSIILRTCEIIGIMVIVQTLFQWMAGIEAPIPVLITKVGIFVVLAGLAFYYDRRLYKSLA